MIKSGLGKNWRNQILPSPPPIFQSLSSFSIIKSYQKTSRVLGALYFQLFLDTGDFITVDDTFCFESWLKFPMSWCHMRLSRDTTSQAFLKKWKSSKLFFACFFSMEYVHVFAHFLTETTNFSQFFRQTWPIVLNTPGERHCRPWPAVVSRVVGTPTCGGPANHSHSTRK